MIENEHQFQVSLQKLNETVAEIEKVKKASDQNPLRNKLLLASLQHMKQELEREIAVYKAY